MRNRVIENRYLRKAMDNAGLQEYGLAKGTDYFYIVSLEGASDEAVIKAVNAPSIPVYAFNRQSIDQWIKDITDALSASEI